MACERYFARQAGADYPWTYATPGKTAGTWHHCCPGGCGGAVTFTEGEDGSLDIRCRARRCTESQIVAALVGGVVA